MKTPPFTEQSFRRRSADRWWHSFSDRGIQITRLGGYQTAQAISREEFFLQVPKENGCVEKFEKKKEGWHALFNINYLCTYDLYGPVRNVSARIKNITHWAV